MFAKLIQHLVLDYKVANLEKELKSMSVKMDEFKTLALAVFADINQKIGTLQTGDLSPADQQTIAELTAALTDIDAKLKAIAPA